MPVGRISGFAAAVTAACLLLTACGGSGDDGAPPLPPPAGVTAHASSSTSVHVMWNRAPENADVTGYEVYESGEKVEDLPGDRYMTDITGLEPSTEYRFTVRARDAGGALSPHSTQVPVTTLSTASEDDRPPTAPGNLRARADGPHAATLTWDAAEDDTGVTSYDIHQGGAKIHSVSGEETEALLTGLRPDTEYVFTVTARDAADNVSPPGPEARITTPSGPGEEGAGAGTAPADFSAAARATAEGHYLDLSWVPPRTGGEVPEYQIHLDGEFATTLVWGAEVPTGKAEYSFFLTEESGATHTVRLRARLPDGHWGDFSEEITVTTGDAAP
ncbi:fibronectin type III domain-containing protein [Streptomyces sodiiphilus]